MRRRRSLSVWPAVADLMTVLAVLGLFSAIALLPASRDKLDLMREIQEIRERLTAAMKAQDKARSELEALERTCREEQEECQEQIREAARNERMFRAIQQVQKILDELSNDPMLAFGDDQTLEFGDDLVTYATNSTHPIFIGRGRERLRRFCTLLDRELDDASSPGRDLRRLFVVEIQGHTDSTGCPGDPHCNWWVSASRAAHFVALMRDPSVCPGGRDLQLEAVGLADTKPVAREGGRLRAERRIGVRVVPDYRLFSGK